MSKLSKGLLTITAAIIIGMIGKAFIVDESVKNYLVTFYLVGAGLALLRVFINGMIAKMKGKSIFVKVAFFAALLSVGLPFQNWFRTEVIFSMSKAFMVPSILVMVASVIAMTIVYSLIGKRMNFQAEEKELAKS